MENLGSLAHYYYRSPGIGVICNLYSSYKDTPIVADTMMMISIKSLVPVLNRCLPKLFCTFLLSETSSRSDKVLKIINNNNNK